MLHDAGIVHRNLRPENVVFDKDGTVVIIGFGLAATCGASVVHHPTPTNKYQAPEVLLEWNHTFSVDCWGFGILLYMMLFGMVSSFI